MEPREKKLGLWDYVPEGAWGEVAFPPSSPLLLPGISTILRCPKQTEASETMAQN